MVRIKIDLDHVSPFLQSISGIVTVEDVDTVRVSNPSLLLFKCKVTKDLHSIGFRAFEEVESGIPFVIFEMLRPIIVSMVRSYWYGVNLQSGMFEWVTVTPGDDGNYEALSRLDDEVEILRKQRESGKEPNDILIGCDNIGL